MIGGPPIFMPTYPSAPPPTYVRQPQPQLFLPPSPAPAPAPRPRAAAPVPPPSAVRGARPDDPPSRPAPPPPPPEPVTIPTPEELGVARTSPAAGAASGSEPGPATPTGRRAAGAGGPDWARTRARLQELGAVSFQLERLPAGGYRFACWLPRGTGAGDERIDAQAGSEAEAVRLCLERAAGWRGSR